MKTLNNTYKFIGKILPDGHLSLPGELSNNVNKEFDVVMTQVDNDKNLISSYLQGQIEKRGKIKDLHLDSETIEESIKKTFGSTDISAIIGTIRK